MLVPEHVVPKFRFQAKEGYVLFRDAFQGADVCLGVLLGMDPVER